VFDSRVLGPALPYRERKSLSQVAFTIGGHYLLRREREFELGPRDILGESSFPWDERRWGDDFAVLVVEWGDAHGDALSPVATLGSLDARDRERLASFTADLTNGMLEGEPAADRVVGLVDQLRAMGVPLARTNATALREGITPAQHRFARALSELESQLPAKPMWCDLEATLGRSPRQLRRSIDAVLGMLGRPTGGFRRWLNGLRVRTGALLATADGAPIEEVATAVGYGSARSLIFAMRELGLESPGALRRLAREG
jgi:AraC-like DNA-binding protein